MPPHRLPSRPVRKPDVPDTFIINWRREDAVKTVSRPILLQRRPVTACESCRAAKVRCNARQNCDRCVARKSKCVYQSKTTAQALPSPSASSECADGASCRTPSDAATPKVTKVAIDQVSPQHMAPAADTGVHGTSSTDRGFDQAANLVPGSELGLEMPVGWDTTLSPSGNQDARPDSVTQLPPFELPTAPYTLDVPGHEHFYHQDIDTYLLTAVTGGIGSLPPSPLSLELQQSIAEAEKGVTPRPCPCRANLMVWVPKLTRAMQEQRIDIAFQVTTEVAKHCREILRCKTYQVRCTDLLLMMSVLQETQSCFEAISETDYMHCGSEGASTAPVRICFGSYEMASDSTAIRAILALDLVKKVYELVDLIRETGQNMLDKLVAPCQMAAANIAYLEANINHFKATLNGARQYVEQTMGQGEIESIPLSSFMDTA